MLARVRGAGLAGLEAYLVEVEVDVWGGLPCANIIGLADTAVKESRGRVKPAIRNSGFDWPKDRTTVSLAPSNRKKEGTGFDLPIALGILGATGQIDPAGLERCCFIGELSLDGTLRPVKGSLPVCLELKRRGIAELVLPQANAEEAAAVGGIKVWPMRSLRHCVEFLNDRSLGAPTAVDAEALFRRHCVYPVDFSEISGQAAAKRAVEVAAAGSHNLLMIGPPGSGKTMLAKRIPTILPGLNLEEALEVTRIHSVAGTLPDKEPLLSRHPFRQPHHTISCSALLGGGSVPRPGEISLAHNGVLFLDELPEFRRDALESLRQPLEDGHVRISRAASSYDFPARFMLICAMNPCPCGYFTHPAKACRCSPNRIHDYMGKISGPLMDRIDIHIELAPVKYAELTDTAGAEPSQRIRERVERTREIQRQRLAPEGIMHNSRMDKRMTGKYCVLETEAQELLKMAMSELGLSARAYDRILKISRTIADMEQKEHIGAEQVAEAIQYRVLDRPAAP